MASNKVFLRNNTIIEIHVIGDQTPASIEQMGKETEALLTRQREQGLPCLILDDLTRMRVVDPDGRKKVVELARQLDYDKTAMVGKGGLLRIGANLMLRAVGKAGKIRYFDDRRKALAWLVA
ncbi:MAG TPA: STAS/SEC14 domain-containing protein [Candidatus Saccharimonadales bacterium]|nr:STAS/SEC14 domain-containing protein [Candidatus Saccharimonadales bacterium]